LDHKRLGFVIVTMIGLLLVSCGPEEVPPGEGITPSPTNTATLEMAPPPATATVAELPSKATPTVVEPSPTATNEQPLAAVVNGQLIFLADYQEETARFEAAMAGQGFDLESEDGKAMLAQMHRQVLDLMIEQVLIKQAAAKEGVAISEEELEATIQESIKEVGGQASFEEWLQTSDLTYEDFREAIRFQLLVLAIFERATASVLATAEQVHARHILVDTEEEAQAILTQLQAGEDFAALARQRSQDENTKETGGDLGFFPRGLLISPEVEEAAFALLPGQISEVVRSQFGYHIVQILEKVPDRPLPPELLNALKEQAFARWIQEQRDSATIERFID
jgi:peptidyl-prolyl cis-trans isomerase C